MEDTTQLVARFEGHRGRLRAVAYRMLGNVSEAEDAVQDAWLRLSGSDAREIENLGGWLTTVVARLCLNVLRSRATRREESLDLRMPDPIVSREDAVTPEHQALQVDAVGLAMLVVLDTLSPADRGRTYGKYKITPQFDCRNSGVKPAPNPQGEPGCVVQGENEYDSHKFTINGKVQGKFPHLEAADYSKGSGDTVEDAR